MYWHPAVYSLLDVRILLRESRAILQQRRSDRNERIAEDSFWKDPPNTFENIVWPAYEDAHRSLFENEDVQNGELKPDMDITLLEAREVDMSAMVDETCEKIWEFVRGPNM
jgi:nicotinamide/nicotinate riboside kinase